MRISEASLDVAGIVAVAVVVVGAIGPSKPAWRVRASAERKKTDLQRKIKKMNLREGSGGKIGSQPADFR